MRNASATIGLLFVALLVAVPAHRASAQVGRVGLSNPSHLNTPPMVAADSVPRGHWKTGMLVGAGVGLVLGGVAYEVGEHISDRPDSVNPAGILVVVAICSLIGGLIGSMFH
jgi:hypothetical protein